MLGRPVFFVDDDPERDRAAQAALERAARQVGFTDIAFQIEPIAAALDYETTIDTDQIVLVADIGGGTSDFSLVRVGPKQRRKVDRRADILANHGVHVAGTDFDRHIELAHILPVCGYRGVGPTGREVPSKVYFDLATWHLINTVYAAGRVAELQQMRSFYADLRHHARLMDVVPAAPGPCTDRPGRGGEVKAMGQWSNQRGSNILDGGAHFYGTYACADGKWLAVGPIEPQFYRLMLNLAGLDDPELKSQWDAHHWPALKAKLGAAFKAKPRDEWCAIFEGADACVSSWQRPAANTLPVSAKAGGNYLNSQQISMEAARHGYHEGIALNVEAC